MWFVAGVFGCGSSGPGVLDQAAWYDQLVERRPALMEQHDGGVDDPAWQALVLRPRYRNELLRSPTLTYEDIVAREYDDAERATDDAWAQSLRDAQTAFQPTATLRPGRYPLEVYASFVVGSPGRMVGAEGFSFKTLLEIDDVPAHLGPDGFVGFAEALERAGFAGDFKIDLRPGATRFQFNNVIVHAPAASSAACAEATGRAYFGGHLRHVARGVDDMRGERGVDWHHFLLTGGDDALPEHLRSFVKAAGRGRCR